MYDNTIRLLEEYGGQFAEQYKQNLLNSGRKATSNLINSISTRVVVNDTAIELYLDLADYYYYIENGRSAGKFPPVDNILQWIHAKQILPREINGKLPTEQQLAYLIGRKIANEGFEGSHDLENTKNSLEAEFTERITEALKQDFINEFNI